MVYQDWRTDWFPATPEGLQFGLPKYHGALALYYNQDLFDAARLPYPDASWDHEDHREAMVRLTADADADGVTAVWGSMVDISWDRLQVHVNAIECSSTVSSGLGWCCRRWWSWSGCSASPSRSAISRKRPRKWPPGASAAPSR